MPRKHISYSLFKGTYNKTGLTTWAKYNWGSKCLIVNSKLISQYVQAMSATRGTLSNITDNSFTLKATAADSYTGYSIQLSKCVIGQPYTLRFQKTAGVAHINAFDFVNGIPHALDTTITPNAAGWYELKFTPTTDRMTVRFGVYNSGATITFSNYTITAD